MLVAHVVAHHAKKNSSGSPTDFLSTNINVDPNQAIKIFIQAEMNV